MCDVVGYILVQLQQLGAEDGDAALDAFRAEHLEAKMRRASTPEAFAAALPACFEFVHSALDGLALTLANMQVLLSSYLLTY